MKKMWGFLAILALAACSLSGCRLIQALAPTPTPTSTATPSPTPTATPTAAPTQAPTPTPPVDLQPLQAGQHPYALQVTYPESGGQRTVVLRYLMYAPKAYGKDPKVRWPLILFLHGSGEAGNNLQKLTKTGLPLNLQQNPDFPFLVISPQLAAPGPSSASSPMINDPDIYLANYGWGKAIEALEVLLDRLITEYPVDRQRVYLTGLSLGGFGAWDYALRHPGRFAAVVPIAGGYTFSSTSAPENICGLKNLPIWAFHGKLDEAVPFELSQILVDALKTCSGKARLTLYPDGDHHASWTRAYADPALWEWLLAQRK